ncbi:MAG: SEC-C metal-binding domain-containing protein [Smithellaceae bacterium]|jgi:hypothetical protein
MNEATFEARLNARIQNLFPTIDSTRISHQNIFDLQLGHHRITVDGKPKERAGGRLDILILVDEIPVLVFELKSPGVQINDADRDQGISYARLMDKMPPLVVISNGMETRFYNTYDKELWIGSTISEETIRQLLQHALTCAASDRDDAVRLLLGYRPEIWTTIIQQATESSLRDLTGEITDWSRPLSTGFSIPRQAVTDIGALLAGDARVLILAGPPLSGKTNVLQQFCNSDDHPNIVPFYIDGSLVNFGLVQYIANLFSQTLFRATPLEEIRQWLIVSLRGTSERKFVFVIDGGINASADRLATDLNEMLLLFESSSASIVLALNDSLLPALINEPGRTTKTPLGRKAKILKLSSLTNDEFAQALEYMAMQYLTTYDPSIHNGQAFRNPRVLRVCAAQISSNRKHLPSLDKEQEVMAVLPGIPSIGILRSAWSIFVRTPELRDDLRRLARAFLADEQNRIGNSSFALLAYSTGIMTSQKAEDILGADRLHRLRSQGYVALANGPSCTTICVPKLPEALSAAAAYEVSAGFDSVMAEKSIEAACDYLLEKSESFPYGDIVGALAIVDITSRSHELAYPIVASLIQRRPVRTPMGKEATIALRSAEHGEIRLHMSDEDVQSLGDLQSNTHPWLILSHLATYPIVADENNWDPYLQLLLKIGSYEYALLRPDFLYIEDVTEFHVHEIGESGEVVCPKSGIVEPITLAIQCGFCDIPQEMLKLCNYATEKNNIYLAYRLLAASASLLDSVDKDVATAAAKAREILNPIIKQDIEDRCKPVVHEGQASEGIATKAKKIGRNDQCPCGSGLKYKKCHGH